MKNYELKEYLYKYLQLNKYPPQKLSDDYNSFIINYFTVVSLQWENSRGSITIEVYKFNNKEFRLSGYYINKNDLSDLIFPEQPLNQVDNIINYLEELHKLTMLMLEI